MRDETLSYSLRNCDETKGTVVREDGDLKAILLKKRIRYSNPIGFDTKTGSGIYELLVLTHEGKKVGGVLHCPHTDVHFHVFKQYRNKGYLSRLIRDGFLKSLWPDVTTCTIVNIEEYERIEHLITIAGFSVHEDSVKAHERELERLRSLYEQA